MEMSNTQIINSALYSLRDLEEEIEDNEALETINHIKELLSNLEL